MNKKQSFEVKFKYIPEDIKKIYWNSLMPIINKDGFYIGFLLRIVFIASIVYFLAVSAFSSKYAIFFICLLTITVPFEILIIVLFLYKKTLKIHKEVYRSFDKEFTFKLTKEVITIEDNLGEQKRTIKKEYLRTVARMGNTILFILKGGAARMGIPTRIFTEEQIQAILNFKNS